MRFQGSVERDDAFWLAAVPVFDAMTQGRTRHEALEMMTDWFVTMLGRPRAVVRIHTTGRAAFEVAADDTRSMVSLLLRRQRQKSGLSLAQAADRLGARSRNAYARYEQGGCVPTMEKLDALLRAIAPGQDIVLSQSDAA